MKLFIIAAVCYLILINIVAIAVTAADKRKAVKDKWRVSEAALLTISALGGSLGMYITMKLIHHKTRRLKFMLGIPLIFVIQCLIFIFVWRMIYG